MRVVLSDSSRSSERAGSGKYSSGNQLEHEFQSPLHPDVAFFADTAKRPVVGHADPVVLPAHVKRKTVSAGDPSWKLGELNKHVSFHLDHCKTEFPTACEAHSVHLVNNFADDVNRCHVLNDERENR